VICRRCLALNRNKSRDKMKTELIIAIVSAVVALSSAAIAIFGQLKSTRLQAELERLRTADERRFESEKTVAKFREPLARAAYDLQSRFFNILKLDLIQTYIQSGDERTRSYVIDNTTFLIAQYLAWTEIIRKEIQFLDLGEDEQTRSLARLQDNIYSIWQADASAFNQVFWIFAGEQRAIGESLIYEGPRGPECIGYGKFLRSLKAKKNLLVEGLRHDIAKLNTDLEKARPRMIALQNALIDLLAFLDPNNIRFPADRRTKVTH
jgi:hypothetical protein